MALARPQYNYGAGSIGGYATSTGSAGLSSIGAFRPQVSGGNNFGFTSGIGGSSLGGGIGSFVGGDSGFGGIGSSVAGGYQTGASNNYQQHAAHAEAAFVHKQFITVAAPEDNDNLERSKHLVIGRPQKNYRVVFIRAPSSSNANVKLSAEYAPREEKTVIYVLSKKDSSLEVGDIATPAPTVPSKPEVFFIKYKTEQEAQHAQRTIQCE